MDYKNYKQLVATPEDHLNFLRVINSHLKSSNDARRLHQRLAEEVKVDGHPFSQAKHLTALETASDGWDFEEVADNIKIEIAGLSQNIKAADTGFDIPHFTTGFEAMIQEMKDRGIKIDGGLDFSEEPEIRAKTSDSDYVLV